MSAIQGYPIGGEILKAIGGPARCTGFTMHFPVTNAVTVECTFLPERAGLEKLVPILKRYKLVEIDPKDAAS